MNIEIDAEWLAGYIKMLKKVADYTEVPLADVIAASAVLEQNRATDAAREMSTEAYRVAIALDGIGSALGEVAHAIREAGES
jgi:hypothetical protein